MNRSGLGATALRFAGAVGTIGLIIAGGFSAGAIAAPKTPTKHAFTATLTGAQISSQGTSFETVYKDVSSLDGTGAGIQDGTLAGTAFPVSGKASFTGYFANGVEKTADTFKLGAPNASGISAITGSGKCAGGTGVHKSRKCAYTFTGTYNTKTTLTKVKITGTYTS